MSGIVWHIRDYGKVAQCPHCERTDITRMAKNQFTCGMASCQRKQNSLSSGAALRKRRAKLKAERGTV